jgi:hypothetical protein
MMSSYDKRIKVDPNSVASLALSKLADGNNMPGYYMYQGGILYGNFSAPSFRERQNGWGFY